MSLTEKQFNYLASKDDVRESEERLYKKMDEILTVVDGIAANHKKFDEELVSNQVAHDRMQSKIDALNISMVAENGD